MKRGRLILTVLMLVISSFSFVRAQGASATCADLEFNDLVPYNEVRGLAMNLNVTVTNPSDTADAGCVKVVKLTSYYVSGKANKVGRVYELTSYALVPDETHTLDVPLPNCRVAITLTADDKDVESKNLTKGPDCGDRAVEVENCKASRDVVVDSTTYDKGSNTFKVTLLNKSTACTYESGLAVYDDQNVLQEGYTDALGPGNDQDFTVTLPANGWVYAFTGEQVGPKHVNGSYSNRLLAKTQLPLVFSKDDTVPCQAEKQQFTCLQAGG